MTQILAAGIAMTPIPADSTGTFGGMNISNVTRWFCNASRTKLTVFFNDGGWFMPPPENVPELVALLQNLQ